MCLSFPTNTIAPITVGLLYKGLCDACVLEGLGNRQPQGSRPLSLFPRATALLVSNAPKVRTRSIPRHFELSSSIYCRQRQGAFGLV